MVTPSAGSVEFVESALRNLPSTEQILCGHRLADFDDQLLLIQWQIARTWIRDGIVRLLGVEPRTDWDQVAWQADKVFRDRLATPDVNANVLAFAQLLDQTDNRAAIRALLPLRKVFKDASTEVVRRFQRAPITFAFTRLRQGENSALADLIRLVHPRRVVRSEEKADADQRAFEALTAAFQAATGAARPGQNFASFSLPSPFSRLGLPADPGWDVAAAAFLDEEIEWELADHLPGIGGVLDRGAQGGRGPWAVRNAERDAWRRARAMMRGGGAEHIQVNEESIPDPTANQARAWVGAFLAAVRERYGPRKSYRALRAYVLNDISKEEAARQGKVDPKTLDAFINQVRRDFSDTPPEK